MLNRYDPTEYATAQGWPSPLASPGGWGRSCVDSAKCGKAFEFGNYSSIIKMAEATVQEYTGGSVVLYEDLTEIERRFEDVEVDLRMLMGVFIIE